MHLIRKRFFHPDNINEHNKSIASARGGNVIGGGDWADNRIIPDLVKALEKNEALNVRNPKSIRPWQHVLELLYGYLLLGMKLYLDPKEFQGAYNFGPEKGDEMTVEELVNTAIEVWGSGVFEHRPDEEKLHEAGILRLEIDKSKKILDWYPHWRSDKAVEMTMNWYKNVSDGKDALECCKEQIAEYFK